MPGKKGMERTQDTSAEDLREISKRLKKASSAMLGLAKALEESADDSVRVEGHVMLERGFDSISKFVGNCQKKIREF